jgi:hypothetical protein
LWKLKKEETMIGTENLLNEIIAASCPGLGRDIDIQTCGVQKSPDSTLKGAFCQK